jgi:GT2 family glycosyltransferase
VRQDDANDEVALVLVTLNRTDELRRALESAFAQVPTPDVFVIDDGSSDGTSDMVRDEFPRAELRRHEDSIGPARCRDEAGDLVHHRIVVYLDDDAYFPSSATVRQTVSDFDDPRIAVVAIPFTDVLPTGSIDRQHPPTDHGTWIGATYIGAAYAMRGPLVRRFAHERSDIRMYVEEADVSLRLLDAGYVVRIGRGDPAIHMPSEVRSLPGKTCLNRRNELVWVWCSFPTPWNVVYLGGYAAKGFLYGLKVRMVRATLKGILAGLAAVASLPRRPVNRRTFRLDRRLRRGVRRQGALRLRELESELPPLDPI